MKNTIDMAQTRECFKLENIIIVKRHKWYLKLLVQVTKSNDGGHLHQLVKISEYNVVHE